MDNYENFERNKNRIIKALKNSMECNYYRNMFEKNNINVDEIKDYNDFKKIPILTKTQYQNEMRYFINDICYQKGFSYEKYMELKAKDLSLLSDYLSRYDLRAHFTSGTSGKPMSILVHNQDLMNSYINLNLFRERTVKGIFKSKYIWIWSNNIHYYKYNKEMSRYKEKKYGYQFFIFDFSEAEMERVYDFIKQNMQIKWMVCSPSFLFYFISFLKKEQKKINELFYIECQSEKLFEWQIDEVGSVTDAIVRNIYSSNEVHFIGGTCGGTHLHQISKNAYVEVDGDKVLVTNLSADFMPIIRYDLGDRAKIVETECDNNCEFTFELLGFRTNDNIKLKNGSEVDFHIIAQSITVLVNSLEIDGINEYQVIQTDYDQFQYKLLIKNTDLNIDIVKVILEEFLEKSLNYKCGVAVYIYNSAFASVEGKYKYFISKIQ